MRKTARERFWVKVRKTDYCWWWLAGRNNGYGSFRLDDNKTVMAHRFAFQEEHGWVPRKMVLDHLCQNKLCVRPSHLDVVSIAENVARGGGMRKSDTVSDRISKVLS